MTRQQMEWAKRHDWFITAYDSHDQDGWIVQGRVECVGADGSQWIEYESFTSFQALRAWAGY